MLEKDYLKNKIKEQYKEEGSSLYFNNEEFIKDAFKDSDLTVSTTPGNFLPGCFYFVYYDISSKISYMEKLNPVLLIDSFDMQNTKMYFVLNLNFLPVTVRVLFFNSILNYNLDLLDANNKKDVLTQKPIPRISFNTIYKMLKSIGFEWAIRKMDIKKINKIYKISSNILDKFISMSTHSFTKVDDNKLVEIWRSKIEKQDEREKEMIKNLMNDFTKLSDNLNEKYQDLNTRTQNTQETLKLMQNI